jgi:2-keto-4-pentenoate hydratase/2-oxohepta-3-ene-1,7-dioic acid hydratase in catechol pathway
VILLHEAEPLSILPTSPDECYTCWSMRLVSFQHNGAVRPGVIEGEKVVPLDGGSGFGSVLEIVEGGSEALGRVRQVLAQAGRTELGADSVAMRAPIPRPTKIICVGLNYRDHAAESKMEIPKVPTIFSKYPNVVIGPGEKIVLPRNSEKPDYEAEMAFVIGRRGRHVPADRWKEYVFGYMNVNDVSARDFQMATSQWMMGKTFDTFAPCGPALVTADEIEDPHNLDISLTINGERLQHSNTKELIFRIPDLIAFLSSVFTLEPGDIVSTGTPSGVGFSHKPPRWLRPGDEVVVKVEGLGELKNPVVAEQ